jgi:hypothetical protein
MSKDNPNARSEAAEDALNIGHACLRSECWPSANATACGARCSEWMAPRQARRGLHRRPARKRTPLHCARPQHAAEARFTAQAYEFIE